MRKLAPLLSFAVLLAAAALWLDFLMQGLPDVVAVHFDAQGTANGFTTRATSRKLLTLLTLGSPLFLALVTALVPRLIPASMLNIPNRGYWMAPGRARESVAFMSEQGLWFSCIFLIFLSSVDWMVVQANTSAPPHLSTQALIGALILFFGAIGLWAWRMFRRFRLPA
jgi:hypothetical protein